MFSQPDISYQQLELDAESQQYLTVNIHRGIYRYVRMPNGVNSAPRIFQSFMYQNLKGWIMSCACKLTL